MPSTIVIPRPGPDEHLPHYGRYIARVPGDDVYPVLDAQVGAWAPALRGLTEAEALHRYAPGKWSVKEVLVHVCDSERVFAYRALRFARGDATPLPGFDENAWAPNSGADRRPIADLADELRAVRTATLALFTSFDTVALDRRGQANGTEVSVRALAWITAGHALHHQAILRDRYGLGA